MQEITWKLYSSESKTSRLDDSLPPTVGSSGFSDELERRLFQCFSYDDTVFSIKNAAESRDIMNGACLCVQMHTYQIQCR
jgi:hypothetical protein